MNKNKTLLVGMAKNEGPWILEWIAYHRVLGFDNILIITNDNSDGSDNLLKKLNNENNIKVIWHTPLAGNSVQAIAYDIAKNDEIFKQHEWVCVLDIDEFVVLHEIENINEFLKDYNEYDTICLNWLLFSSAKSKTKEEGLVIERFKETNYNWRSSYHSYFGNDKIGFKSISKTEHILKIGSHRCVFSKENVEYIGTDKKSIPFLDQGRVAPSFSNYKGAHINHYIIKSFEEFLIKLVRGRSVYDGKNESTKMRKMFFFLKHDLVSRGHIDESILKYRESIKNEIKKLSEKLNLQKEIVNIDNLYKQNIIELLNREEIKKDINYVLNLSKTFREINFYLPHASSADFPENIESCWDWMRSLSEKDRWWGKFHWTLQPYLFLKKYGYLEKLKEKGIDCKITKEWPKKGFVISHNVALPKNNYITDDHKLISLNVDKPPKTELPINYFIVHNNEDVNIDSPKYSYIPPFSQIDIKPRNHSRPDLLKNIAFFGYMNQLDNTLKSNEFNSLMLNNNFNWIIQDKKNWNDYSNIDAIIAIRSFDKNNTQNTHKSFLKLINAWKAGVIFITNIENAYLQIGEVNKDFFLVNSINEIIDLLKYLNQNPKVVEEAKVCGRKKLKEFEDKKISELWYKTIVNIFNSEIYL